MKDGAEEARLSRLLQAVEQHPFRHIELRRQLSDPHSPVVHRSRQHYLLLGQLHALGPGRGIQPGGDSLPGLPSTTQVLKTDRMKSPSRRLA